MSLSSSSSRLAWPMAKLVLLAWALVACSHSPYTSATSASAAAADGEDVAYAARATQSHASASDRKKNILFFAIDDLRPSLGCYGVKQVHSPNIDKLAARSLQFNKAYCQVADCSPSRTSLLTGRRPDTTHVWMHDNDEYWRNQVNATTIPQHFKQNGYISIGMGKVFHPGKSSGNDDELYSWSPEGLPYYHAPLENKYGPSNKTSLWWGFDGFQDNQLPDGQTADHAVSVLESLKKNRTENADDRPFFLAVGFHKPHTPWLAPKEYFDLYPDDGDMDLPMNPSSPVDLPPIAWEIWGAVPDYDNMQYLFKDKQECFKNSSIAFTPQCMMPSNKTKQLRKGYYAAMSYMDAQVGRVVDQLTTLGLANDTIIVLWSDHGWQLGEHGEWAKFTNFETGTRVPLVLHVPGVTEDGKQTNALVELIDVFPTLTELTGVVQPPLCSNKSKHTDLCVEGTSMVPLLTNAALPWKQAVFSQYARPNSGLKYLPTHRWKAGLKERVMGYTMRTDQWRYTEWIRFNNKTAHGNWSNVWGRELYDHSAINETNTDFNDENRNLGNDPSMADTIHSLHVQLVAGWRGALPPSDGDLDGDSHLNTALADHRNTERPVSSLRVN